LTLAGLAAEIGIDLFDLTEVANGTKPANLRTAEGLLTVFNILELTWAMEQKERYLPYAFDAILKYDR